METDNETFERALSAAAERFRSEVEECRRWAAEGGVLFVECVNFLCRGEASDQPQ